MKFIISVDCEGPACVFGSSGKSLSKSKDYIFACKQATRETNACINGLFDSGAKEIFVWDSHGEGQNLFYENLDKRCSIIAGNDFVTRFPCIDASFTAILMVGYHSMEGTKNGVLSHTYSSATYKSIKVNGLKSGEILLDASVAGEYEVPLIFLSSDEAGCKEALDKMPWVETVVTKKGFGQNSAVSKHPDAVTEEIYLKVRSAVKNIESMRPYKFSHPILIEIEFKKVSQTIKSLLKKRKGWKVQNFHTIYSSLPDMTHWIC